MQGLEQQKVEQKSKKTIAQVLGEIVWLMTQSPTHKHFSIADLEWMILPPVLLEQYRIYYDGTKPVAVALWAYLSEEVEARIESGEAKLEPHEWRSGLEKGFLRALQGKTKKADIVSRSLRQSTGQLWLIDLICPISILDDSISMKFVDELKSSVFRNKKFKYHVTDFKLAEKVVKEIS